MQSLAIAAQSNRADKAFLRGAALNRKHILSYYEEEALFQKAAIEATDKIILIVDHSKFEKKQAFRTWIYRNLITSFSRNFLSLL